MTIFNFSDVEAPAWQGARRANSRAYLTESVPDKNKIDRSSRNYSVLGMKQLFLGFAGRQPDASRIHKALKRLNAGDVLSIKESNENIFLITSPYSHNISKCSFETLFTQA